MVSIAEIVGQVVRPVVVTQPHPTGGPIADTAEAVEDAQADWLQASKRHCQVEAASGRVRR